MPDAASLKSALHMSWSTNHVASVRQVVSSMKISGTRKRVGKGTCACFAPKPQGHASRTIHAPMRGILVSPNLAQTCPVRAPRQRAGATRSQACGACAANRAGRGQC
eukprot:7383609-Prymnesium_polylepis.1